MTVFSARALFNMFHSGYCSAYIQNPAYLLLVDFRTLEDWIVERVITSHHHERLLDLDRSIMMKDIVVRMLTCLWFRFIRLQPDSAVRL